LGKINSAEPYLTTIFGSVHLASNATADGLVAGFAVANPSARNAIIFVNLPCGIVREVDSKIDNGNPATGRAISTACANDDPVAFYAIAL